MPNGKTEKVLSVFTHQEVDKILAQPNRSSRTGKRDYAILMLGKNTGLRIGDIVELKLSDINWKKSELNITQEKTKTHLVLPLDKETENAIVEYILNGRPKIESPNVFLKSNAPYGQAPQTIVVLFQRYSCLACRRNKIKPLLRKSFHGLRVP